MEYKIEYDLQRERTKTQENLERTGNDPLVSNKKRAYIMAIHLHNYRQLLGINTVVAFGGIMIQTVDTTLAIYANLLLNGAQGIVTIPATFWVGKRFGRRPLFLWSGIAMGLSAYLVAIGYLVSSHSLIIGFMFIYMISFGLLFSPVSWAYPAEIVSAR
jgi:MFS family permease